MLAKFAHLTKEEVAIVKKEGNLPLETANRMIENVVGTHALPLAVAVNVVVNGREYAVPYVTEEPSVVAAASYASKLARASGGFTASADEPIMIGQIQLVNVPDAKKAVNLIQSNALAVVEQANTPNAPFVTYGGGVRGISAREVSTSRGTMVVVELKVDCRDSMGANSVNTFAETIAPKLEELTGGTARLRILSNLAIYRKARAHAVWKKDVLAESAKGMLTGEQVREHILDAYEFAVADVFRAATHNKGIMNGVDAVALATGNDWRAVEAGAHAYAAMNGGYRPLTTYRKDGAGNLVGEIELPLAVATVGGAVGTHPTAMIAQKILGVKTAKELACVMAAVGLAQNFAALRALATEGIQVGHMALHARNIAVMAGAKGNEIDVISQKMADEKKVRPDYAQELLSQLRKKKK